ncbi:MAG TPA: cytidylate kinase family protein [Candidatus Binataceae bacterium]|nr:cytidylate kinase family protein [Candidatus Binataceae bacterium]
MALIAIGQQLGSRGTILGQLTAERLGYRFISSTDVLAAAARRYQVTPEQLQLVDERTPHFWERLRTDAVKLYAFYGAMLLKEFVVDRTVVVGRSTPLFVPEGAKHVLRVRTVAPFEHRCRQVAADEKLEAAAAAKRVRDYGQEVRTRLQTMLNADVDDPCIYDFVLNTAAIPMATLAEMLAGATQIAERDSSAESWTRLRDASITAQVRAALFAHPKIGHAPIEVATTNGVVTLNSSALVPPWDELANGIARGVEGVVGVELGIEEPPIPPRAA